MYWFITYLFQPIVPLCLLTAGMLILLWRKNRGTRPIVLGHCRVCGPERAMHASRGLLGTRLSRMAMPARAQPPRWGRGNRRSAGAVVPPDRLLHNGEMGASTRHRCVHTGGLYRQGSPCLVVVSGDPVACA